MHTIAAWNFYTWRSYVKNASNTSSIPGTILPYEKNSLKKYVLLHACRQLAAVWCSCCITANATTVVIQVVDAAVVSQLMLLLLLDYTSSSHWCDVANYLAAAVKRSIDHPAQGKAYNIVPPLERRDLWDVSVDGSPYSAVCAYKYPNFDPGPGDPGRHVYHKTRARIFEMGFELVSSTMPNVVVLRCYPLSYRGKRSIDYPAQYAVLPVKLYYSRWAVIYHTSYWYLLRSIHMLLHYYDNCCSTEYLLSCPEWMYDMCRVLKTDIEQP